MTLNKVNVQSVDPRAQKSSAASEEPKLSRENPFVFRDGGNIKGDVHPLRIIREGIVIRKLCQTEERGKLFFFGKQSTATSYAKVQINILCRKKHEIKKSESTTKLSFKAINTE